MSACAAPYSAGRCPRDLTGGQLAELVAQIFAALMPLPAAPVATADAGTDVGNLILYQGSLAQYAQRDEQVRTLGNTPGASTVYFSARRHAPGRQAAHRVRPVWGQPCPGLVARQACLSGDRPDFGQHGHAWPTVGRARR